jgi:anti-anti-sigma factor
LPAIVEFDPHPSILRCRGDEDRSTQVHRRRPLARAFRAQADVTVDLRELAFADSSLMVDLAVLARRLRLRGGELLLRGAQPQVMMVIELVGLDRLPGVQLDRPARALA